MLLSTIQSGDSRADLIQHTSAIIWDEAPMANQAVLMCVDETLRRVMNNQIPFGGKTLILSGDFRQTCPVVPYGSKRDVIEACIKSSPLWPLFTHINLHQLIRNATDPEFADFVTQIGEGFFEKISFEGLNIVYAMEEILDSVFPNTVLGNEIECVESCILAPTNRQVHTYNNAILNRVEGEERICVSADTLKEADDAGLVPPSSVLDYVVSHTPPGLPEHHLRIKIGGIYRLLRNFSIQRGLVKNARIRIVAIGPRLLTVKLLNPGRRSTFLLNEEEFVLLPRITFEANLRSGHTLQRRQFPISPAYASTFNGCQGLTLKRIGIDLTIPVFSHGQLYTAISRVRTRHDVIFRLNPGEKESRNVTYEEILA